MSSPSVWSSPSRPREGRPEPTAGWRDREHRASNASGSTLNSREPEALEARAALATSLTPRPFRLLPFDWPLPLGAGDRGKGTSLLHVLRVRLARRPNGGSRRKYPRQAYG